MRQAHRWKIAASAIAAVPTLLFLYFGIGAGSALIWHFLQAAAIIALVVLASRKPFLGGWALISLALLFALTYSIEIYNTFQLVPSLFVALLFFVPIIVSGGLFIYVSTRER